MMLDSYWFEASENRVDLVVFDKVAASVLRADDGTWEAWPHGADAPTSTAASKNEAMEQVERLHERGEL